MRKGIHGEEGMRKGIHGEEGMRKGREEAIVESGNETLVTRRAPPRVW